MSESGAGPGDGQGVADAEAATELAKCPNCGAVKQGRFCAACGQNDRDYLHSVFPVVAQVLAETFEADSRLWRTMRALFLRPGFLSLEFSRNRRAHYLSPFRLYLFTSILFFLVLSLTVNEGGKRPEGGRLIQVGVDDDDKDIEAFPEAIETLRRHLDEERDRKIDEILARPEAAVSRVLFSVGSAVLAGADAGADQGLDGAFDIFVAGQLVDVFHAPLPVVRDRFLGYLPVAMFFVLPIYALMLKLVFIRRHRFYAEHLVFSMHIHTIAFIVFGVAMLTPANVAGWLDGILLLAVTAYYLLALKRFYGTGVIVTIASLVLLTWLYSLMLAAVLIGAFATVVLLF